MCHFRNNYICRIIYCGTNLFYFKMCVIYIICYYFCTKYLQLTAIESKDKKHVVVVLILYALLWSLFFSIVSSHTKLKTMMKKIIIPF
jgi:hypothetical protein